MGCKNYGFEYNLQSKEVGNDSYRERQYEVIKAFAKVMMSLLVNLEKWKVIYAILLQRVFYQFVSVI